MSLVSALAAGVVKGLAHALEGLLRGLVLFYRDRKSDTGGLELDLGNLAASDNAPIDAAHFETDPSAACLEAATRASQVMAGICLAC